MTVLNLTADSENLFTENAFATEDPRALAFRDLLPRFVNASEAKIIIETNSGPPSLAAAEIGRADLTTLPEIRNGVRAEWDHVLHLSQLIHHDVDEYWNQK